MDPMKKYEAIIITEEDVVQNVIQMCCLLAFEGSDLRHFVRKFGLTPAVYYLIETYTIRYFGENGERD